MSSDLARDVRSTGEIIIGCQRREVLIGMLFDKFSVTTKTMVTRYTWGTFGVIRVSIF